MESNLCDDLEEYKPLIKGIMESSGKLDAELGVLFCHSEEGIEPANTCKGDRCTLRLEDCDGDIHSSFHTHVENHAQPSPEDLIVAWKQGSWGLCIGVPEKDEVKCYEFIEDKEHVEPLLKQADKVWRIKEDVYVRGAKRYGEYRGELAKLDNEVKKHMVVCKMEV